MLFNLSKPDSPVHLKYKNVLNERVITFNIILSYGSSYNSH